MRVPVELLVLACVVVGTLPAWSVGPLLATAAAPVVGGDLPEYSLSVWHGFNTPLIMSLIATGDYMGMLATVMNALALGASIERQGAANH